ncbi:RES family NAD+ phosphorylase [Pseudomonas rubra]|uniref:RES family NAD+ phosphorylase n=1 Tax=Pseudomonas rubra TaxID=2942627 RepID=A0ABT5PDJ6_9PSED|nr:RES family NAD+ phosphorylase [Pseudomonas rubra]MDD1016379.1 RES family NAD+ phosphorylase [Pseudomonas rubra]MDD1036508.1 RES family NAD+ phosphorylase [Pseudomonas rubra]MDD1156580.1 RES family NAD+ phosphorylase [Pseudomonas rubra]
MQLFEDEDSRGYICIDCLDDSLLKSMFSNQPNKPCRVCQHSEYPAVRVQRLVTSLLRVIPERFAHVQITQGEQSGQSLAQVVECVIACPGTALSEEMAAMLIEHDGSFFHEGASYCRIPGELDTASDRSVFLANRWQSIADELTHRQRFFNDRAQTFFAKLFEEATQAIRQSLFDRNPAVTTLLKQGKQLYRARRFDHDTDFTNFQKDPGLHLGAPPKQRAGDNRMNCAGISLFYAAQDIATSIAEIRPSVGDRIALARFRTTRPLKLFDFTGLDRPREHQRVSDFSSNYEERRILQALLNDLHRLIARPVRRDSSHYIVTQAMAEYLNHKHEEAFDGIKFSSSQNAGGVNIVLFAERAESSGQAVAEWEPVFPVAFDDRLCQHQVKAVQYQGDW